MKNIILSRGFWGILIVILGLAFLLSSLGLVSYGYIWSTWWPLIIIFLGVTMLLGNRSNYIISGFIILLGVLFQIDRLSILDVNVFQVFWPLIIIVVGLSILFHKNNNTKVNDNSTKDTDTNLFAALSSIESKITSSEYRGGRATAFMGGIALDLRKAEIKNNASLSLLTFMGGIELRVPESWNIEVSGTPLLGGWENAATKPSNKNAPTLNIDATCIMGGVEIKN